MGKYFALQLKRSLKMLPFVMCVILILMLCVSVVVAGFVGNSQSSEEKQRFKIALTGDVENKYIDLGLMALQNFDDTRFSMELFKIEDEKEAEKRLIKGEISAYVILPEQFIEKAISGNVEKITYVTSTGSQNIVTMFKNEITQMVTDLVVFSQKGVYAISELDDDYNINDIDKHLNDSSIEFARLSFERNALCIVEELGVSSGIGITEYYICSICVILLALMGISFVTIYVNDDHSLNRLLSSKGHTLSAQIVLEWLSHLLIMIGILATISVAGVGVYIALGGVIPYEMNCIISLAVRLIAVTLTISAFNMFMFELSGNLITAVLIYFLGCIGQGYISGCFYPLYALPLPLQSLSHFLPWGLAREFLEGSFLGELRLPQLAGLLAYTTVFIAATLLLRRYKTVREEG